MTEKEHDEITQTIIVAGEDAVQMLQAKISGYLDEIAVLRYLAAERDAVIEKLREALELCRYELSRIGSNNHDRLIAMREADAALAASTPPEANS